MAQRFLTVRAVLALAVLLAAVAVLIIDPDPVRARPVPGDPFAATLDGWPVWQVVALLGAAWSVVVLWRWWRDG